MCAKAKRLQIQRKMSSTPFKCRQIVVDEKLQFRRVPCGSGATRKRAEPKPSRPLTPFELAPARAP